MDDHLAVQISEDLVGILNDDDLSPKESSKFAKITTTSPLDLAQFDVNLSSISFLLCIFDNIVGPKIVHHWVLDANVAQNIDDRLLKYIAVHTLNGELYQEKLHSNLKYRLYLIQEIDRAILSVFFDASTVNVTSSSYNNNHSGWFYLF
jgi:hypothetical protein